MLLFLRGHLLAQPMKFERVAIAMPGEANCVTIWGGLRFAKNMRQGL